MPSISILYLQSYFISLYVIVTGPSASAGVPSVGISNLPLCLYSIATRHWPSLTKTIHRRRSISTYVMYDILPRHQ